METKPLILWIQFQKFLHQKLKKKRNLHNNNPNSAVEVQTDDLILAREISVDEQNEIDCVRKPTKKYVISDEVAVESYKSGKYFQIGVTIETEKKFSEVICQAEDIPENKPIPETESIGSQTSTSFTSKTKKIRVKIIPPSKEISVPTQNETKQKVNMIQTFSELGETLDDIHKSLDIAHNHLETNKKESFGTQTTLGAVEYIIASEAGNEESDEAPTLYIPSPYFNALLNQ